MSSFDSLIAAVETAKNGKSQDYDDSGRYYPERDKAGNGFATIRFLPAEGGALPFVKRYTHRFKHPVSGKWFIEHCPTTDPISRECPVCEANSLKWNTGIKTEQAVVSMRKRKLTYYSNILVVNDPKTPENNGKVFLFSYGQKIFDKIYMAMKPQFGETPFNPFDLETGANFELKIRIYEEQTNYDMSSFSQVSSIKNMLPTDWKDQLTDLSTFVDPSKFKSYDDIALRFFRMYPEENKNAVAESEFSGSADRGQAQKSASFNDDDGNELSDAQFFAELGRHVDND